MKIKILLLSIVLSAMFASTASAQQKPLDLSIKIYGGYGVFSPGSDIYNVFQTNPANNGVTTFEYKNIKMNLGSSLHFGGGVSLKLSEPFSIGLDVDYLTGGKNYSYSFSKSSGSQVSSYHVLSFIPNVSYGIWSQPKYAIYNTLGIVAAVATKLDINYSNRNSNQPNVIPFDSEVNKFGLNFGLKDALGIKIGLAKNIKGFAEVTGYFLAASPTSKTLTMTGLTDNQTFKSSGSLNVTGTGAGTANESRSYTEGSPTPYHFSSFGLNIGVSIGLKK